MKDGAPSKLALAMTVAVVVISAVLLVLGGIWYGFSWQVRERFWADILGRLHGPMTFRFFVQPAFGFVAALRDGIKDTRTGHKAFFWTALWDSSRTRGRLREGLISTSRLGLLGFAMDTFYQLKVLDQFYPGEAVVMVLLLAILPYFVFRWIVERVARRWFARKSAAH
jgi:hypothetical protein